MVLGGLGGSYEWSYRGGGGIVGGFRGGGGGLTSGTSGGDRMSGPRGVL